VSKTRRRAGYERAEETYTLLSFLPVCDDKRHLICSPYSVENLHVLAKELGIGRGWFHEGRLPHYDIPKKRVDEISDMCMKVNSRTIVNIIRGKTVLE
jgi:hypothetical protein